MKVGIVTYWRGTSNYGQIVQHWALQIALKKMGHTPFLIRFYPGYNHGLLKRWLKLSGIVDDIRAIIAFKNGDNRGLKKLLHDKKRAFHLFRNANLNVSKHKYYRLADLQANPPKADAYITGSDQVWSQLLSDKENEVYFLNFGDTNVRRIAYAPSFSMDEYPKDLVTKLQSNLSRFNSISCREYSGVDICKKAGFLKAQKVLDPTFLICKEDYEKLIKKVSVKGRMRSFVFIYSLNIASSHEIRWNELRGTLKDYSYIVTPSDGYFAGDELFDKDVVYSYGSIQDWLADIYNSSLVVTPSFHGVALSIILEKDFVYTPLEGYCAKGNNRIIDLLIDLKLTDRILTNERTYKDIINKPIDWEIVNNILSELRKSSVKFLVENLNEQNANS